MTCIAYSGGELVTDEGIVSYQGEYKIKNFGKKLWVSEDQTIAMAICGDCVDALTVNELLDYFKAGIAGYEETRDGGQLAVTYKTPRCTSLLLTKQGLYLFSNWDDTDDPAEKQYIECLEIDGTYAYGNGAFNWLTARYLGLTPQRALQWVVGLNSEMGLRDPEKVPSVSTEDLKPFKTIIRGGE